jgi:hypothetical protein
MDPDPGGPKTWGSGARENYFILNRYQYRKKFVPINRELYYFYQKIVTKPSEIWVGDPRSGIRKEHIPDPRFGNTDRNLNTKLTD